MRGGSGAPASFAPTTATLLYVPLPRPPFTPPRIPPFATFCPTKAFPFHCFAWFRLVSARPVQQKAAKAKSAHPPSLRRRAAASATTQRKTTLFSGVIKSRPSFCLECLSASLAAAAAAGSGNGQDSAGILFPILPRGGRNGPVERTVKLAGGGPSVRAIGKGVGGRRLLRWPAGPKEGRGGGHPSVRRVLCAGWETCGERNGSSLCPGMDAGR